MDYTYSRSKIRAVFLSGSTNCFRTTGRMERKSKGKWEKAKRYKSKQTRTFRQVDRLAEWQQSQHGRGKLKLTQ